MLPAAAVADGGGRLARGGGSGGGGGAAGSDEKCAAGIAGLQVANGCSVLAHCRATTQLTPRRARANTPAAAIGKIQHTDASQHRHATGAQSAEASAGPASVMTRTEDRKTSWMCMESVEGRNKEACGSSVLPARWQEQPQAMPPRCHCPCVQVFSAKPGPLIFDGG